MKFASLSLLAAATMCASAAADTTDLTYGGVYAGNVVTITSPGYSGGVNAGSLMLALANTTGASSGLDGSYLGFCVDTYQFTNTGPNPYMITSVASLPTSSPMGAVAAQAIADLYAFAGGAQYAANNDLACAFQLAVWECVFDVGGPLDVNGGAFSASGLNGGTSAYLALLLGAVGTNGSANLVGLGSESYQDFVIEVPGPGAVALLGLAGLMGRRSRR